jgi:hypothetical protein
MNSSKFKIYLLVLFLVLSSLPGTLIAQRFEATPYYGFVFAGKLNFVDGEMNIKDNPNYGIMLDFELDRRHGLNLELSYDRLNTNATYKKNGQYESEEDLFDMFIEYYQLGALYDKPLSKNASAFGFFTGGVARFSPQTDEYGDDYRFAITGGGGVKYFITESIGIRLQGRLKMPFFFSGGSLYVGSGGSGFFMGTGTVLLQMDLTAGVIIRIGE